MNLFTVLLSVICVHFCSGGYDFVSRLKGQGLFIRDFEEIVEYDNETIISKACILELAHDDSLEPSVCVSPDQLLLSYDYDKNLSQNSIKPDFQNCTKIITGEIFVPAVYQHKCNDHYGYKRYDGSSLSICNSNKGDNKAVALNGYDFYECKYSPIEHTERGAKFAQPSYLEFKKCHIPHINKCIKVEQAEMLLIKNSISYQDDVCTRLNKHIESAELMRYVNDCFDRKNGRKNVAPSRFDNGKNKHVWFSSGSTGVIFGCDSYGYAEWYFEGQRIQERIGENFIGVGGLLLYNARKEHEGVYECRHNQNSSFYKVRLSANPTTIRNPEHHRTFYPKTGEILRLKCDINDVPPMPTVVWLKNDKPIASSERVQIFVELSSTVLTIYNVNSGDSGKFKCLAHNFVGHSTSDHDRSSAGEFYVEVEKNPAYETAPVEQRMATTNMPVIMSASEIQPSAVDYYATETTAPETQSTFKATVQYTATENPTTKITADENHTTSTLYVQYSTAENNFTETNAHTRHTSEASTYERTTNEAETATTGTPFFTEPHTTTRLTSLYTDEPVVNEVTVDDTEATKATQNILTKQLNDAEFNFPPAVVHMFKREEAIVPSAPIQYSKPENQSETNENILTEGSPPPPPKRGTIRDSFTEAHTVKPVNTANLADNGRIGNQTKKPTSHIHDDEYPPTVKYMFGRKMRNVENQ